MKTFIVIAFTACMGLVGSGTILSQTPVGSTPTAVMQNAEGASVLQPAISSYQLQNLPSSDTVSVQ